MEGFAPQAGMFPGQQAQASENDQKSMDEDELKKVFRLFDADSSGDIDISELQDAMRMLGVKCTANSSKKVISAIDTDGNGTVSWKEFYEFFSKVRNPEEIKHLLTSANQRFLDYKSMVASDPNFQRRFFLPELVESANQPFSGHNDNVEGVAWISETQFVTASIDHDLRIWDINEKKSVRTMQLKAGVYAMSTLIDANKPAKVLVGLASKADNLLMCEPAEDSIVQKYEGHDKSIFSAKVGPDKRFCLSGSKNGTVCFHDLTKATPVCSMDLHTNTVYSCDINEDCTTICTASADGTIQVNDMKAITMTKSVVTIEDAAATGIVYSALWRGEHEIISCGDDFSIKRWDLRHLKGGTVTNYFGHTSPVRSISLSPCKNFLLTGANDGAVRFWVVDERKCIQQQMDAVDTKIEISEVQRKKLEQDILEGASATTALELEKFVSEIGQLYDRAKDLKKIDQEREDMGCLQAHFALSGHTAPVVASTMREDPKDKSVLTCLSAGHDQTCRLFNVKKPDITKFRCWAAG